MGFLLFQQTPCCHLGHRSVFTTQPGKQQNVLALQNRVAFQLSTPKTLRVLLAHQPPPSEPDRKIRRLRQQRGQREKVRLLIEGAAQRDPSEFAGWVSFLLTLAGAHVIHNIHLPHWQDRAKQKDKKSRELSQDRLIWKGCLGSEESQLSLRIQTPTKPPRSECQAFLL